MNNVPIVFFQVAAAAIPTLLIAIVVGLKQADAFAQLFKKASKRLKPVLLGFWLLLVLMIVLGELCAFRAIARGSGNSLEAESVWAAIMICLGMIVLEMLQPLGRLMTVRGHVILLQSAFVAFGILAVYTLLILWGVVPL